jgi:hypothetical protein
MNPLTNRRFFNSYNPIVHNFEVRGTVAYLDTAVHEGVHAFIGRRMPIIWDLGEARFLEYLLVPLWHMLRNLWPTRLVIWPLEGSMLYRLFLLKHSLV